LRAKVLKLEEKLFDGKATRIVLPAVGGEMCLLPRHISIITPLRKGAIKIFRPDSDRPTIIETNDGICSFSNNEAIFILGSQILE
jgi:F-type H+-transporting ATPase subunit epsilon